MPRLHSAGERTSLSAAFEAQKERPALTILRKATGRALPVHPLVFISGCLIVGTLFALQEWISVRHMNYSIGLGLLLKAWCVQYLLWGLLLWLTWWAVGSWLQRASTAIMLTAILPLSFVISVVEEAIWVICFPYLPLSRPHMDFWHRFQYHLMGELVDGVFIFWFAFLLFRGVDYYLRFREKEATASQLQVQLAHAQLRALRMHLNPHFLFNTLNSISSLMRSDVANADLMLEQFSSLLRITLERGDVQLIRLCEEMEFIEMYMAMQDRRFSGRIRQQVRIDPGLHDALVPAMILQPIVENAYGHGLSRIVGQGELTIDVRRERNMLRIAVTNTGPGLDLARIDSPAPRGLGLSNVTNRLSLHYPEQHTFAIAETSPGVVSVTLTLPLELRHNRNDYENRPAYGA